MFKWKHRVFIFLCLTYFANTLQVHPCWWKWQDLILFISYSVSSLYIILYIIVIQSSTDGNLGWFCVLAIVNSAMMNIWVYVSFSIKLFLNICPEVGFLGHMVLIFWGIPILFSIVVVLVYIPTNSVGGFPFLHILFNICYLLTC